MSAFHPVLHEVTTSRISTFMKHLKVSCIWNHPWRRKLIRKKVIRDIFLFMEISQVDFRRWQIAQQLLLLLKQREL